jgi:hypothetical protein
VRKRGDNSTVVDHGILNVSVTWVTARRKEMSDARARTPIQLGFRLNPCQLQCSHFACGVERHVLIAIRYPV